MSLINGRIWPRIGHTGRYAPHTGFPRGLADWMAYNEHKARPSVGAVMLRLRRAVNLAYAA